MYSGSINFLSKPTEVKDFKPGIQFIEWSGPAESLRVYDGLLILMIAFEDRLT